MTYSGANGGIILLSGVNTYTGPTAVGVSGDTSITVQAGVANAISTSSSLILAGGTFSAGGYNQALTGTLGLTASSSLMFGASSGVAMSFANSSAVSWTFGQSDKRKRLGGELSRRRRGQHGHH